MADEKLWTVGEVEAIVNSTLDIDLEDFTLVDGRIVREMPKGHIHNLIITLLAALLQRIFGQTCVLQEKSLHVEPESRDTVEPDIMVISKPLTTATREMPGREDVVLIVEVANEHSLKHDTGHKAKLYAELGVQDYWVVDIVHRQVLVHRECRVGLYTSITVCDEAAGSIAPLAAPSTPILLRDFLPSKDKPV